MAGSVVISKENVWLIGLHGFMPIIERIRAAYSAYCEGDAAGIFSPLDEGFDFINLENLSDKEFTDFVGLVERELMRFSADSSIEANWRTVLTDGWKGLLKQLSEDPRYHRMVEG